MKEGRVFTHSFDMNVDAFDGWRAGQGMTITVYRKRTWWDWLFGRFAWYKRRYPLVVSTIERAVVKNLTYNFTDDGTTEMTVDFEGHRP